MHLLLKFYVFWDCPGHVLTLLISNSALSSQSSFVTKYFAISVSYSHNRCIFKYFMEVLIVSQNAKNHGRYNEVICIVTKTSELSLVKKILRGSLQWEWSGFFRSAEKWTGKKTQKNKCWIPSQLTLTPSKCQKGKVGKKRERMFLGDDEMHSTGILVEQYLHGKTLSVRNNWEMSQVLR